jgi:hypothetical protein
MSDDREPTIEGEWESLRKAILAHFPNLGPEVAEPLRWAFYAGATACFWLLETRSETSDAMIAELQQAALRFVRDSRGPVH